MVVDCKRSVKIASYSADKWFHFAMKKSVYIFSLAVLASIILISRMMVGRQTNKIAYRETRFLVKWQSGDIVIACSRGNKEICIKNIPVDKFRYRTDESSSFTLNNDDVGCQRLIRLSLKQKFTTTDIEFYIYIIENRRSDALPPATPGPSTERETFLGDEKDVTMVTDEILSKVSNELLPSQFSAVRVALDIKYSVAEGIKERKNNVSEQYCELFHLWRIKSRRTLKDLKKVLIKADAEGLFHYLSVEHVE